MLEMVGLFMGVIADGRKGSGPAEDSTRPFYMTPGIRSPRGCSHSFVRHSSPSLRLRGGPGSPTETSPRGAEYVAIAFVVPHAESRARE